MFYDMTSLCHLINMAIFVNPMALFVWFAHYCWPMYHSYLPDFVNPMQNADIDNVLVL